MAPPLGLKDDTILPQAERDETKPSAADIALTAAAVLIALRLGRKVPIATILKVIKEAKPADILRRKTVDRHIYKRPEGIPKDWEAVPTTKGGGGVYKHPTEKRTYVKVQKADPTSSRPGQQYDNVRWQKNEQSLDVNGNPVKLHSQKSHIPLKDFKFNLEKMK